MGHLRIDLATASFMALDHQMHRSNIFFVFGLGLMIATAEVIEEDRVRGSGALVRQLPRV